MQNLVLIALDYPVVDYLNISITTTFRTALSLVPRHPVP